MAVTVENSYFDVRTAYLWQSFQLYDEIFQNERKRDLPSITENHIKNRSVQNWREFSRDSSYLRVITQYRVNFFLQLNYLFFFLQKEQQLYVKSNVQKHTICQPPITVRSSRKRSSRKRGAKGRKRTPSFSFHPTFLSPFLRLLRRLWLSQFQFSSCVTSVTKNAVSFT